MLYLIDDLGRVLRPTPRLQATFGTRLPATEFADFLARNLGWVSLAINKTKCDLRLRPSKVNEMALLAAVDELRDATVGRYWVTWFGDEWSSEGFATANAAV